MASIRDYLKKLLYQYDCVVVPELGAFLTHYQAAAFTETSGLYSPPRKRVAFNEALRLDDGILANYIMLHEPVTREGAQRHISAFVADLRQQATTTERFELEGIGAFTLNEEGRLQFNPSLRHNFFGEAYGMSDLAVQTAQRQSEPAIEAVPVTAVGPVLVQKDDTTLTPYRPQRSYWRVAAVALLVGSLGTLSYFSVINPGQPFQSSLDPASLLRVPASLFEPATDKKPVPTPVPVLKTAVTPVATINPVPSVAKPAVTPTPVPVTPTPKPAPIADKLAAVAVVPASVTTKAVLPVAKPVRTSPHYTVIAGVFFSKRNALKLTNRLRKSGYADAFVIVPTLSKRGWFKVAAAGSAVREEAIAKMAAINSLAGTNSWILKN